VLAKVTQPGPRNPFCKAKWGISSKNGSAPTVQIVHDPAAAVASANRPLLVYVNNDMLVASPDVVQLQRAAARMQQSSAARL